MLSGHRPAGRRRGNGRAARLAVPLAIPMALGLTLGIILAVSSGSTTHVVQSALGSCASVAASGAAPAASGSQADPGATATAADPGATATAADPGATANAADPGATANAADAASGPAAAASASASAAPCPSTSASASAPAPAAAPNMDCDIIVPANPLSARGLATPYQLTGPDGASPADSGCNMANAANLGAFVQATILNPGTGALSVYNPLVITQGSTAAVAPVVPRLPRNAVVTIDFGFQGTNLIQVGATPNALRQGRCVNGLPGSPFGQQSMCNGINFFNTASALMRTGRLRVPFEGTSAKIVPTAGRLGTGRDCPNVRNFDMIDQDQSDNVTSVYLLDPNTGQTAQDTAANEAKLAGTQALSNGSDNALVDKFMDPALGCTPFMAPDLANNRTPTTSQALDELLAAAPRNTPRVPALVPENDPMTLDANGNFDAAKTNLYRAEVGQPAISPRNDRWDSPPNYCQNMINIQGPFLAANQAVFAAAPSPVPGVGVNLYAFLANRLLMSFGNLGCQNFGLTNPVTVVLDANGAATSATINTTPQQASATGANGGNGGGGGQGGAQGGGQGGGAQGGTGTQQSWTQAWQQWLGQHMGKGRNHHRPVDSGM
jgi:hypothetical protein